MRKTLLQEAFLIEILASAYKFVNCVLMEDNLREKEVPWMNVAIGIVLVLVACAFAVWVVRIANDGIRNFDEKKHESFLGK